MPVYVDDMRAPYGRMFLCHMVADTEEELHAMADAIGIERRWYQYPHKSRYPHYDISLSKRTIAVRLGAIEISKRQAPGICKRCIEHIKSKALESVTTPATAPASSAIIEPPSRATEPSQGSLL